MKVYQVQCFILYRMKEDFINSNRKRFQEYRLIFTRNGATNRLLALTGRADNVWQFVLSLFLWPLKSERRLLGQTNAGLTENVLNWIFSKISAKIYGVSKLNPFIWKKLWKQHNSILHFIDLEFLTWQKPRCDSLKF